MKKLSFTFLFLLNCYINAQTLDPYKFFPSSVSNVWEYIYSGGSFQRIIIKDSTLQDNSRLIYFNTLADPAFRIDTNFNMFWMPSITILNWYYYKLDSDSGDHWMVRPETFELERIEAMVRNKYPAIFLGRETIIMEITFYELNRGDTVINEFSWPRFTIYLGYGIGEIMEFDEEGGGPQRILQGCIIDGDTIGTITNLIDGSQVIPLSFKLFQNYPNPFNPTTTIKYNLPEPQNVKLSVYSLLGEEVKILVDDYKSAGNHSVIFNASDLASGVYIYTLQVNGYSQSRKMILLR